MIKTPRVSAVTLLALGTLLLGASSASAAGNQVPFKASYQGSANWTSQTTIALDGTGFATHMCLIGNEGTVYLINFDSTCPDGPYGVASINVETLTAANGDTLWIQSHDVACPTGPGLYHGTGHWTVTGGTGRFSSATGQGSYDGSADFNAGTFTIDLTGALALRVGA